MSDLVSMAAARERHTQADRAMVYSLMASGIAAGIIVSPAFFLITPPLALALMWASHRATPRSIEPIEDASHQLPVRVDFAIHDAIAQLSSGDARQLLGDVVRQARPLFAMTSSHFDASKDDAARAQAAELVLAACDTALELSRIDALLASDARAKTGNKMRDAELRQRLSAARALFASRLSEAATALGAMYVSAVEHGTAAADVVAELTAELSADAAARTKARAEIDELLGSSR